MSDKKVTALDHSRLDPSELRVVCDSSDLPWKTTEELDALDGIIGQDRALRAIRFGLRMRSFGYNLYVAGTPGTGKKTLIRSLVEEIASKEETPNDVIYVNNFENPERPKAIQVPPGIGCHLKEDMERLVETLLEEVPKAFKSEDFENRRNQIMNGFQTQRTALIERAQQHARERNLVVKSTGGQILTVPILEGQELTPDQYAQLPSEQQEAIQENQMELAETIQEIYRQIRSIQHETHDELKDLDRTVALIASGHYLDEIRTTYKDYSALLEHLEEIQRDIIDNIEDFLGEEAQEGVAQSTNTSAGEPYADPFKRYSVNVIVDNSKQEGAPVITETHPMYRNLIGYAEREAHMGALYTDFTMIRAGSVLAANHGYLILDLVDLMMSPLAWESLKRVLQDGEVKIQDPSDQFGLVGTLALRPEAVKVDLKVIILGSSAMYGLLYGVDEDFQKLFKIKAEFDTVMKKNERHLSDYARFVKTLCDKEELRHFDRSAVAALVEHSSRMVSDKTRLTLRFSDVADLIRESTYWASESGRKYVSREHVEKTISEKIYRSNLFEERVQEMIDEGSILIATKGAAVGQINGLSVYQIGDYAFGKPTRLTAQVSMGNKGVVNIEREAKMSGNIHDKGVLILSGWLHGKFGQKRPLSLQASICFEQSYSGVDGDSASSTEFYAILSSLTAIPIKQSIAVTGSINQKGVIQPIGGVNEKIEGFFETCKANGFEGNEGVIIPHQNVQNLMLKKEVIEAVAEGRFHIYPIENVDEGIEILMGKEAGLLQDDGSYPKGSVYWVAEEKLTEMARLLRKAGKGGGSDEESDQEESSDCSR